MKPSQSASSSAQPKQDPRSPSRRNSDSKRELPSPQAPTGAEGRDGAGQAVIQRAQRTEAPAGAATAGRARQ